MRTSSFTKVDKFAYLAKQGFKRSLDATKCNQGLFIPIIKLLLSHPTTNKKI
ncbi:hypothetical protein ACNVED_05545 [Legionella sp. D16C41]|uniref:hypothetical protein n=1 Tax=Legionella sp. D16C41 TaxID=3402688 RepID=UPI003AF76F7B